VREPISDDASLELNYLLNACVFDFFLGIERTAIQSVACPMAPRTPGTMWREPED